MVNITETAGSYWGERWVECDNAKTLASALNRQDEPDERQARAVVGITWGVVGATVLGVVVTAVELGMNWWLNWMAG